MDTDFRFTSQEEVMRVLRAFLGLGRIAENRMNGECWHREGVSGTNL